MVAMIVSSGSSRKVTPAGGSSSDRCIVAAISISDTSTTMASGMSVGRASMLSSWVTWSSTPPSFTPGASSVPWTCTGHRRLDLLVQAHLEQVDVDDLVPHRVKLLVLDDHRARGLAPDLEIDQRRAVHQHLAQNAGLDLEGGAVAVAAAPVDHPGHKPLSAQALGGAGTALGALVGLQGGALACFRHDGWPV